MLNELNNMLDELHNTFDKLKSTLDKLRNTLHNLKTTLDKLKNTLHNLETTLATALAQNSTQKSRAGSPSPFGSAGALSLDPSVLVVLQLHGLKLPLPLDAGLRLLLHLLKRLPADMCSEAKGRGRAVWPGALRQLGLSGQHMPYAQGGSEHTWMK